MPLISPVIAASKLGTSKGAEVLSLSSCPEIAFRKIALSFTVFVIGPA